jgi:hypothetical protein
VVASIVPASSALASKIPTRPDPRPAT